MKERESVDNARGVRRRRKFVMIRDWTARIGWLLFRSGVCGPVSVNSDGGISKRGIW